MMGIIQEYLQELKSKTIHFHVGLNSYHGKLVDNTDSHIIVMLWDSTERGISGNVEYKSFHGKTKAIFSLLNIAELREAW